MSSSESLNGSLPSAMTMLSRNSCLEIQTTSPQIYEMYRHIFVIALCLASFNLVTNGFAYLVFSRYTHRSVLINLLLALSIGEIAFNLVYILNSINEMLTMQFKLRFASFSAASSYSYFIVYFIPVALTGCHIFRNWVVVLISAYRFEVVCRALSQSCRVFRSELCTIYICIGTAVLAILSTLPRVIERRPYYCADMGDGSLEEEEWNATMGVVVAGFQDELKKPELRLYVRIYYSAVLFVLQSGGPTLAVFVLSVFILVRLAKRQRYKRSLQSGGATQYALVAASATAAAPADEKSSVNGGASTARQQAQQQRRRREKDGGRLVIALCVFFFMFEMPTFISKCGHHWFSTTVSQYIAMTANFSTLFDSASNFFVYLASNRSFRQNALASLCCRHRGLGRGGLGAPSVRTVMI